MDVAGWCGGSLQGVGVESDSVPTSSVLFGSDGTQLPDPLPVLPDALTGPARSSWTQTPEIPPVRPPPVPDGRAMRAAIAAALSADPAAAPRSLQADPPAPPQPGYPPHRPPVPAPQRRRPPVTQPRAFTPIPPPADLRRRIARDTTGHLQPRSDGGIRVGCVVALIIFGVVAFYLIAGIVQSVSAWFS